MPSAGPFARPPVNRRSWGLLSGALVLLVPLAAQADPPAPLRPIPPGDDVIVPMQAGEKAPFGGQLFDTRTALRWGGYLDQCTARLELDVVQAQKVAGAETTFWKTKADLEAARYETVTAAYREQTAKLEQELRDPPFYRSVWFGVSVGIVGTVLTATATAYLVHAVQ